MGADVQLIKDFLQNTNDLIEQKLNIEQFSPILKEDKPTLLRACGHLCISKNAKRIRPLICLYSNLLFNDKYKSELVKIAVASEFIHAASLMHDDIVDNANLRRGKFSVNEKYGNNIAVLAGDFLLTEAFDLIKDLNKKLIDKAIFTVKEMTNAALSEILCRGQIELDEEEWKKIAMGKTGALFSWCIYAAYCINDIAFDNLLWQAGLHMGIIFQIADDLKDFQGHKSLKDLCQDIHNKELSLPIILAIKSNKDIEKAFKKAFKKEDISNLEAEELKILVLNSSAFMLAKNIMNEEILFLQNILKNYDKTRGKIYIDQWIEELSSSIHL